MIVTYPSQVRDKMDTSSYFKGVLMGYYRKKEGDVMYKNQERKLMWVVFIVAAIMTLSILGRIFGS